MFKPSIQPNSNLASLALFLILSACATAPPDTHVADEAAIKELDEQWSKTAGKLDVDGTLGYYTEDAVLLPPNSPIATGKAAIRAVWASMLVPGTAISWKMSKADVSRASEMAYSYGSYDLVMKGPDGASIPDKGKFIEVWKKQADGKWKVVADMFNSDLAMPAPPPPPAKKK